MNDTLIDLEYIQRLSSSLNGFEKKRKDLWNARCPFCGDSKKSLHKKRLYIYFKEDHYSVKCHNCGYSETFSKFLELISPQEYKRYILDKLPQRTSLRPNRFGHVKDILPDKVVCKGLDYSTLKKFDELSHNHPARLYIEKRKIPFEFVFYSEKFSDFIHHLGMDKYILSYQHSKEPRMIIPFYREDGISTVFQARAFSKKEYLRYITIKEDEGESKVYGLDRVDKTKPVYCTEGPLDSLMIPNCIAMSGISTKIDIDDIIYIFDNEPRNPDVVKNMRKKLMFGNKIVIFPDMIKWKDLNDMIVKGGMTTEGIVDIIKENTYSRNDGMMRLSIWSR